MKSYQFFIYERKLITENYFDEYLKPRWDKDKKVVKDFNDIAKKALEQMVKTSKTAEEFISKIVDKIVRYDSEVMTITKARIKEKLKSDVKFVNSIKETTNKNKEGIREELKNAKEMISFYKNNFISLFKTKINNSLMSVIDGKNQPTIEEGTDTIQTLIQTIDKIEPFNWSIDLKNSINNEINEVIKSFSKFTKNMGGPEFKFPVISPILSIAIEYNKKVLSNQGLLIMIDDFHVPFINDNIKSIALITTIISAIELIDDISELHILGIPEKKIIPIKKQPEKPGTPVPTVQEQPTVNITNLRTTAPGREVIPPAAKALIG